MADGTVAGESPPAEVEEATQKVCTSCGEVIQADAVQHSHDREDYCESCWDHTFTTCDRCGDTIRKDDGYAVGGDATWCEGCAEHHSFICDDCGDRFHEDSACTGSNRSTVCESCRGNYFTCDHCDRVLHDDDYGGDGLCNDCYSRDQESDGPIDSYDSEAPHRKFGSGPHWFGVELEVEVSSDCDRGEKAKESLDLFSPEFCIAKSDGSLGHGFELVTAPASLESHYDHWQKFFEGVPSGLKSFNTKTCGLHVHCSREPLSELQIAKIVCFVNAAANVLFVESIAGRPSGKYSQIKPKKIGSASKMNPDRYEAVNLQNQNTIEFRIFKGTLKKESLFKAIEFCDALIRFTKPAAQGITQAMSKERFIHFVAMNRRTWPHLHAFIQASWLGVSSQEATELGFKVQCRVKSEEQ